MSTSLSPTPSNQTSSKPAHYLVLDVRVLEHQCHGGDVLLALAFTAAHLDGMLDALVNLFVGGLACVGQLWQRTIGK